MIRLDDSRDLSWVQIYQQTTLENKVLIERPPTNEHLQIKNADVLHNIVQILLIYFTLFKSLVLCIVVCWIFFSKKFYVIKIFQKKLSNVKQFEPWKQRRLLQIHITFKISLMCSIYCQQYRPRSDCSSSFCKVYSDSFYKRNVVCRAL